MDTNGDKKLDIIAGGAEGFVYSMTALDNGNFTRPKRLKDKSGKEIHLGDFYNDKIDGWDKDTTHLNRDVCLYPTAIDWDNDGDLDLLMAGHSGLVSVRINEGTTKEASYAAKNTYIEIDGKAFSTGKGSNARFVDWDEDGLKDLICGVAGTGVIWLKNKGSKTKPSFEKPKNIISVTKSNVNDPYTNITTEVVDINGDGKKDLLVGAITSDKKERMWIYYRK